MASIVSYKKKPVLQYFFLSIHLEVIFSFLRVHRGECSSVGRAPGCGPGGRGFKSHHSPQKTFLGMVVFAMKNNSLAPMILGPLCIFFGIAIFVDTFCGIKFPLKRTLWGFLLIYFGFLMLVGYYKTSKSGNTQAR